MKMELIRSFSVLGQICHFGAASRQLNISQPSLTKQIKRLEYLLGAALFERGRQGTKLTAFGRKFLEDIQPLMRHADHVWEDGLRAARGERGRLRLGFTFSSVDLVARLVPLFRRLYPAIHVTFEDVSSMHQVQRINEGSLDAGFVRLPTGAPLASRVVASDRLVLVVPEEGTETLTGFDDERLEAQDFLGLPPAFAPGLEEQIQAFFRARGFQPQNMHRVNESMTQLRLVVAGLGVAVMHESALRHLRDRMSGVKVHSIDDHRVSWDVGLVWRYGDEDPVLKRFLDLAFKNV